MNQRIYLILFILVVLIYIIPDNLIDNFKIDLCHQYESKGLHCPHRIHYRQGTINNKSANMSKNNLNKPLIKATNIANKISKTYANALVNNHHKEQIIDAKCNRGGNGDIVKKKLVEGKDYVKVFGKYPVKIDNNRKLYHHPWWQNNY